jgi:hypothetical protein
MLLTLGLQWMTGSIDHATKVRNNSEPQYIYTKFNAEFNID